MKQKTQKKTFSVSKVSGLQATINGNTFVELKTKSGRIIAVWGSEDNMTNIEVIQKQAGPFRIKCDCVKSHYEKQHWWIPESGKVSIVY